MSIEKIMFCPKCRRPVGVGEEFSTGKSDKDKAQDGGIAISCPRCGYMGKPAIVEIKLSDAKGKPPDTK